MNAMIKMHAHSVAFRSVRATRPPFPPTNRSIRLNCPVPVVKASTNEIPKAKVEPFRMISVSEHVRSREATCFGNFSNGLLQTAVHPVQAIILEALRLEIQKAAVRAFGPGAEALVDGSMAKQTQWRESDVDIIVKTDYPVSRSQRERLVEELKLRPLLHPDHVELGCLAIHIKASYDIDVVCTNTEEFGLRPAAEERLKDNPVASGTARVLKFMVSRCLARSTEELKSYHLELLVLDAQAASQSRLSQFQQQADGTMQLFLDVLQAIVDDKPPMDTGRISPVQGYKAMISKHQFKGIVSKLKKHALMVLHLFVMSRPFMTPSGFRNHLDIQSWICGLPDDIVPTPAGDIPRWIADPCHAPPAGQGLFADYLQEHSRWEPKKVHRVSTASISGYVLNPLQRAQVDQLLRQPLGRYTMLGNSLTSIPTDEEGAAMAALTAEYAARSAVADLSARENKTGVKSFSEFSNEMQQLLRFASGGSALAKRMLEARMTWLEGEHLLDSGNSALAIQCLAQALRSTRDGDPFSGFWNVKDILPDSKEIDGSARYLTAIDAALSVCPSDALLVQAHFQMLNSSRYSNLKYLDQANKTISRGLELSPSDAHGFIYLRGNIHGNLSEWALAHAAYDHAIQIESNEPIFYYWRAVCKMNMVDSKDCQYAKDARADFQHFLSLADPGGRKVPEALYSLVMLAVTIDGDSLSKEDFLELVKEAKASEKRVIPILKNKHGSSSDQKALSEMIFNLLNHSENQKDNGFHTALEVATGMQKFMMNKISRSLNIHESIMSAQQLQTEEEETIMKNSAAHALVSSLDPSSLNCWPRVLYKKAVRIVDPIGAGHFVNLCEAMDYVRRTPPPQGSEGWTLILQPGEYKCRGFELDGTKKRSIQLLGSRAPPKFGPEGPMSWTMPTMRTRLHGPDVPMAWAINEVYSAEPQVVLSFDKNEQRMHRTLGDPRPFILDLRGAAVVDMDDICLMINKPGPHEAIPTHSHCILMTEKSHFTARDCVFSSPMSPCVGVRGTGTRCHLIRCTFGPDTRRPASAGVIVTDGASLQVEASRFNRCYAPAVEIRGFGSVAHIIHSTFFKCKQQAVLLYNGGSRLILEESEIARCGKIPITPGLTVGCGTATVNKCRFVDNASEAIVVQADSGFEPPVLDVTSSIFTGNSAAVMFGFGTDKSSGGSGSLVRNEMSRTANYAVSVHAVQQGRQVKIDGNRFHSNGDIGFKSSIWCLSSCQERVVFSRNKGKPLPRLFIMPIEKIAQVI